MQRRFSIRQCVLLLLPVAALLALPWLLRSGLQVPLDVPAPGPNSSGGVPLSECLQSLDVALQHNPDRERFRVVSYGARMMEYNRKTHALRVEWASSPQWCSYYIYRNVRDQHVHRVAAVSGLPEMLKTLGCPEEVHTSTTGCS